MNDTLTHEVTFFVERTTTYFFQCHHCNGHTLVRKDHAAKIECAGATKPELPQEATVATEPKPIGEPGKMLTSFHCSECKSPFDISIWDGLTKKTPMYDSAQVPERTKNGA